jgi:hypothetical protein
MFTRTSLREERAGCVEVTFFLAKPMTDAGLHGQHVKAAHKAHPELPPKEKAEPQLTLEKKFVSSSGKSIGASQCQGAKVMSGTLRAHSGVKRRMFNE